MNDCKHQTLVLLPSNVEKVRCTRCHLTIKKDEIGKGYCPECFEVDRVKRYKFEDIQGSDSSAVKYGCESCGLVVEVN
jgi:late competence protein required for DNA uptake (superfamily II DNA/RNA helicase)